MKKTSNSFLATRDRDWGLNEDRRYESQFCWSMSLKLATRKFRCKILQFLFRSTRVTAHQEEVVEHFSELDQ